MKEVAKYRVPSKETQRVTFSELPKVLSNQGKVWIIYRVGESGVTIRPSDRVHSDLVIEGVADKNNGIKFREQIQQLMKVMSENGDFGLSLQGEAFNASLDFSEINLRILGINRAILTTAHVECLLKIPQAKLIGLDFEQCRFENDGAKRDFFKFLVTVDKIIEPCEKSWEREYYEFRENYQAEQARYKKALEDVKAMSVRLEADPDDLQYEEFSEANSKVIIEMAEKNPALSNKPAFKKLFVIASIVINQKIELSDAEVLQSVKWFIRNSKGLQKFEIHNLENKEYFYLLLKEMKEAGALSSVLFEMMKIPVEAITEYLHEMSGVKGYFYSQDNAFSLRPHDQLFVNVYTFEEGAFRLDTLRQCVEATKNSVQLHVCRHVFSLHEVEYLISLPSEKLSSLTFDNECEFSPEAKVCLFEKGQVLFKCIPPNEGLYKEYQEYRIDTEALKRVKALVERYKNDAVSYSELLDGETRKFIIEFNRSDKTISLSDEETEALEDLFDILIFNGVMHRISEVDVSSNQSFRVMRWMLSHANRPLPTLKVYKVQEVCALIAAHAQNGQRSHATIVVPASGEHLTINCNPEGTVRLSMTGVPQNAEMFNQMTNSIRGRLRLEFFKDQFLPNMDLSNPSIEAIDFADRESRLVISDEYVHALKQAKHLKYFRAVNCDFNSPQTKEAFVDAILANESLRELVLSDCGLTKKHIEKITAYAKSHPCLIKVVVSANAFREGEADELLKLVSQNKAHFDKMEAHKQKCNWFIQDVRKVGKPFQENKEILEQSVRMFKDFYREPACVAAYVEALQEYVKKMSFSAPGLFVLEMVVLDKLMSVCEGLSVEDRQKILDATAAAAVVTETLSDTVLIDLLERNHNNDALLECQRKRFGVLEREFIKAVKAQNFSEAKKHVGKMDLLTSLHTPVILFQKLYDAYLQFARLYSAPECITDGSDMVLGYLASIPASQERLCELAQKSFRAVFCKKIREILLSDSKTEKSTQFQNSALRELDSMANNPKLTTQDVLNWINTFIDDSSRIVFREKYITNRGNKVEKLEQLGRNMQAYIRQPIPSAPPKEEHDVKSVVEDVIIKEEERQVNAFANESPRPIQPAASVYPRLPEAGPVPVAEPFFVPPVQYSAGPAPVSPAQLVAGQRARDAEPVLQGVAAAPANIWPAVPAHPAGESEHSVEEVSQTTPQKNNVPRKAAFMEG